MADELLLVFVEMPTDLFRSERDRSPDTLAGQIRALWLRQSGWRQLLATGVALGLAGAITWMALAPRDPEWVLATRIEQERAALVVAALLDEAGIPLRRAGADLLVPAKDLALAHRVLAANPEPMPPSEQAGGWGRVLGEGVSPKTQLERELAESLTRVTAVRAARVHLSLGRKSPFRDRALPPSAAVLLQLHDGATLTPAQAEGIRELVAGSLEGASPKHITLLDQDGRSLVAVEPTAQQARAALEAERNAKVRAVLEPMLGPGRVLAVTTIEPGSDASTVRARVAVLVDPEPRGADHAAALERWAQLARDAAGIDEARGDTLTIELAAFLPAPPAAGTTPVMAVPPSASPAPTAAPERAKGFEPDWRLLTLSLLGLVLLLAVLAITAWWRLRLHRRSLATRVPPMTTAPPIAAAPLPPAREPVPSRLDLELARAAQVAGSDPEATAMVISTWLTAGFHESRLAAHNPSPESDR